MDQKRFLLDQVEKILKKVIGHLKIIKVLIYVLIGAGYFEIGNGVKHFNYFKSNLPGLIHN